MTEPDVKGGSHGKQSRQRPRATIKVTMEQPSLKLTYSDKLFDEVLSEDQLRIAYKAVWSNKGSPGIDKVSVEHGAENHQPHQ